MKAIAFSGLITLTAAIVAMAPLGRAEDIDSLPVTVTFVVSGGMWEDAGEASSPVPPEGSAAVPAAEASRRGYYKLVSVRQPDRTAKIYLQQVAATENGPELVESVELEEFTALRPYVTDIRPEDSSGISRQPGMFATVYLKTSPTDMEPESWTVLIDDLGEIRVERATN